MKKLTKILLIMLFTIVFVLGSKRVLGVASGKSLEEELNAYLNKATIAKRGESYFLDMGSKSEFLQIFSRTLNNTGYSAVSIEGAGIGGDVMHVKLKKNDNDDVRYLRVELIVNGALYNKGQLYENNGIGNHESIPKNNLYYSFETNDPNSNVYLQVILTDGMGEDFSTFCTSKETVRSTNNFNEEEIINLSPRMISSSNDTPVVENNNAEQNTQNSQPSVKDVGSTYGDNWWGAAFNLFSKKNSSDNTQKLLSNIPGVQDISGLIFMVGNILFIIITSILGVRYIWGSAESKASIKDSLMTLAVAAIFFYGWNAIKEIINIQSLFSNGSTAQAGVANTLKQIYNTVLYIVNILAVGGIVYIGVKYVVAGAEGRAEMKVRVVPIVIGLTMVYATVWFINLILDLVLKT